MNFKLIFSSFILIVFIILCLWGFAIQLFFPMSVFNTYNSFMSLSISHLLGTDNFGRDIFILMLIASKQTMEIIVLSVLISFFIGIFLSAITQIYEVAFSNYILERLHIIIISMSPLLLIILISLQLGNSIFSSVLAIGVFNGAIFFRYISAQINGIKKKNFAITYMSEHNSKLKLLIKQIIPIVMPMIIIQISYMCATTALIESALSYLKFSTPFPNLTFGGLIAQYSDYILIKPYFIIVPLIFIFLLSISFYMLGEGIKDKLSQKL